MALRGADLEGIDADVDLPCLLGISAGKEAEIPRSTVAPRFLTDHFEVLPIGAQRTRNRSLRQEARERGMSMRS